MSGRITPEEFALAWSRSCYRENRADGQKRLDELLDERLAARTGEDDNGE